MDGQSCFPVVTIPTAGWGDGREWAKSSSPALMRSSDFAERATRCERRESGLVAVSKTVESRHNTTGSGVVAGGTVRPH